MKRYKFAAAVFGATMLLLMAALFAGAAAQTLTSTVTNPHGGGWCYVSAVPRNAPLSGVSSYTALEEYENDSGFNYFACAYEVTLTVNASSTFILYFNWSADGTTWHRGDFRLWTGSATSSDTKVDLFASGVTGTVSGFCIVAPYNASPTTPVVKYFRWEFRENGADIEGTYSFDMIAARR